jgi:hypothetical protein
MFLQIAFKAFPRTQVLYLKRTFYFSVYTNHKVFSDMFNGKQIKAAALPVSARVRLSSGEVFQSHIPVLWKIGSACRTTLDSLYASAANVVPVRTQLYGWHHVFQANRTFQFHQEFRRKRVANLPYLEQKRNAFRHVVYSIFISSMVITKCSNSLTSGHMV